MFRLLYAKDAKLACNEQGKRKTGEHLPQQAVFTQKYPRSAQSALPRSFDARPKDDAGDAGLGWNEPPRLRERIHVHVGNLPS